MPGQNFIATPIPGFSSSPASWDYGLVSVGITSTGTPFTVKNIGRTNLVISGTPSLAGGNPSQFHITYNTCANTTLVPNGTCRIIAKFNPTTAGTKTAYINVPDNSPGHPHKIPLSGKGGTEQSINGSFTNYLSGTARIPTYWVAVNFSPADGKNSIFKDPPYSVKIANTLQIMKTFTQTRSVTGGVGNAFLLSLWVKGQGIPTTSGVVQGQVLLYSGSTLVQTKTITFANGTYGFTQKLMSFAAINAYNKIVIKLTYSKGSGAVWFDALSLLRSP